MRKTLIALMLATSLLAVSGTASAIVVGGIDFGSTGLLSHLETTTIAETLINGNNQELFGYGKVNTVNGDSTYCADGSANCSLYFRINNYISQNVSTNTVEFKGGIIELYFSNQAAVNLSDTASGTNYAWIGSLSKFAKFSGVGDLAAAISSDSTLVANGNILGAAVSFTGSGLAEVVEGWGNPDAETYLNGNSEFNSAFYAADLTITTSGSNARSRIPATDLATCYTVPSQSNPTGFIGQSGDWCVQGSADVSGATVIPEPGSLALLGVGLMGLASLRRRMKK